MGPNKAPKKKRNPLAVAVGICAGVTIGGAVIKARSHRVVALLLFFTCSLFFLFSFFFKKIFSREFSFFFFSQSRHPCAMPVRRT